jgi:hypothetical protein
MNDLMDMIVADESPSDISDKVKEVLFNKASGKVDNHRPEVALSMFDAGNGSDEVATEE